MRIALIAAVAANGVIGHDNQLPWHLPEDLKAFKRITLGKPLIMGRKTYESIGRPLPGRTNIILSRQSDWAPEGVRVAADLEQAFAIARQVLGDKDEVMVIGGEQIYRLALPFADRLYLTLVDCEVMGDTRFPDIDPALWREVSRKPGRSETESITFSFVIWDRVKP